ncbi:MAG: AMP-binding protein, partial [Firmicutes bacterium]|nr:AMP-binding protein [Bacillota bacterium]
MERSVLGRLDRAAELWPDRTMLKDSERSLTFSEFSGLSKRIGTALAARIEAGKPVAVLSGRHVFTPAAYLGIVRAGCFYAPMDGDVPKARLNQVLSVINADLMVVDRDHLEVAK